MIRYKRTASDESQLEGSAHIGLASDSAAGRDGPTSEGSAPTTAAANPPTASGHHDPAQRRLYLTLLAASGLFGALGLSLLLTWMFFYRPVTGLGLDSAGKLSNLHTVLMFSFMLSLNAYAALIYRTHYARPKATLKLAHAGLAGLNIVMSLSGVYAMYKAHIMAGIPNFYSLHSWIGIATNGFYLSQFVAGFVAFLKPGLTQYRRERLMPWHRLAGVGLLCMATLAVVTGICELVIFQDAKGAYSQFTAITWIANGCALSVVCMTALVIYLLTAPQYLRPRLAEEQPLKR